MRPTRSQFEHMQPEAFEQATQQLMADIINAMQAEAAEIEAAQKTIDQTFKGVAADAEREQMAKKLAGLHGEIDQLVAVQKALQQSGQNLSAATKKVRETLHEIESDGFIVKDDWSVEPSSILSRLTAWLLSLGKEHQQRINDAVDEWDKADRNNAQLLVKAVVGLEMAINSQEHTVKDGEGKDVPIVVMKDSENPEQDTSDLNVTIPGWDHTITGDEFGSLGAQVDGVKVKNPDGTLEPRGLPTGANYGPDGKPLAGFSFPTGGEGVAQYASEDTTVYDMSDPKNPKPVGTIPGISQASFAYDPKTRQMVAVGNTGNGDTSPRAIWKSDPIKPGDPPDQWMKTMHMVPGSEQPISTAPNPSVTSGGNRENQVRQLPDGRWALYDTASNVGVRLYVADRPEDLFKAQPQLVAGGVQPPSAIPPERLPPHAPPGLHYGTACAYGATVVAETQNPDGSITQTFRASAWPPLMYPDPGHPGKEIEHKPDHPWDYHPQTYTYTVQIGAKSS